MPTDSKRHECDATVAENFMVNKAIYIMADFSQLQKIRHNFQPLTGLQHASKAVWLLST
jgi:hypothetical protein